MFFLCRILNRLIVALTIVLIVTSIAEAKLSSRVCRADGVTPLELADPNIPFVYQDVMVGTRLTIIVSSDTGGNWSSDLAIEGEYLKYGVLSARDFNDVTFDWEGSHLEAAGRTARVVAWIDAGIHGFNFESHSSAVPGDWFIIDYTAIAIGQCNVDFYDRSVSWDEPVYYHKFHHVPTRDFDGDTKVGLADFALLAANWGRMDCTDPDRCGGVDLDNNGSIDSWDLMLFADYWIESTE